MWESEISTWPLRELSLFVEAGGLNWHVQQAGSGPAMLLIHGTGASSHSWRGLIPRLARHYAVTAVDLPGHGFTDGAARAQTSIVGMSGGIAALLRALRIEPSYCVGHSAGAVIPCQMALDGLIEPRLIVGLNGAFLPLGGAAAWVFSPLARLLSSNARLTRLLARQVGSRVGVARMIAATGSHLDAEGLDLYARLVRNPRHVAGALEMMGNWDMQSFSRRMPALKTPLALIVAENDRIVPPRQALVVQRRLAGVEVLRLSGVGHLAHEEMPERVVREIVTLCAAHSRRGAALNGPGVSSADRPDRPTAG